MKNDSQNDVSDSTNPEHYIRTAQSYDSQINAILPGSECFFSSCLSFIPDHCSQILELGSGTGLMTSKIRTQFPEAAITGIDHSSEMIEVARSKPELKPVTFLRQDIRDPWPDQMFDLIITTLCLHHIPESDRQSLLGCVVKSLNQGGLFVCGDIIRSGSDREEEIYSERWKRWMEKNGLSLEEREQMIRSRKVNYPEMETVPGFYKKMGMAGFSHVLLPYKHEISAIFIGYR